MQPATTEEEELAPARRAPAPPEAPAAGRCPVAHGPTAVPTAVPAATGGCPVAHGAHGAQESDGADVRRSKADLVVRRLLRIRERPAGVTHASAYGSFQRSMLISAVRCTLTYVVFPFVAPAVGFATGVGPVLGLLIGTFAIVCDVFTIRRFFAVDHKWRWPVSTIAFGVICLLSVLLVQDISHLLR